MTASPFRSWYDRRRGPRRGAPRPRTRLALERLEPREVPAALLPNGNYFEVTVADNTALNGGGQPTDNLFVSMVSQTQPYTFQQYQNTAGQTVYVATVDSNPGSSVASFPLSQLVNQTDGTLGFYVQVFDAQPIDITGGRIYFADQPNAVPISKGAPGGIDPNANFDYDFVEFTVDSATNQLNLDTTQVDQFGMPIYLQVNPVVPDFADGTGIVSSQTRANVIQQFQTYTGTGSNFTAYQGVYKTATEDRLLAPQHVIDADPTDPSTLGLRQAFDEALYNLFNYYYGGPGGGGHHLYLVGNGGSGPEVFDGQVITNFQATDDAGGTGTYTVFQFTGTGYTYDGTTSTLSAVNNNGYYGGATYQIFYPYFSDNEANSFNTGLSSASPAPQWFDGQTGDLSLTSAGRMVFGASGVFADDVQQQSYYQANPPTPANPNFDHTMLGNLENQLVTMLNRGIAPATGSTAVPNNFRLRTGSNSADDLIYVDLTHLQSTTTAALPPSSTVGATTFYLPTDLLNTAGDGVYWNSLNGTISYQGTPIQTFHINATDIAQPFGITTTGSPSNFVTSADFVIQNGVVTQIAFNWQSAVNIPSGATVTFSFDYGPASTEAHYATLHLFSPYNPTLSPVAPTAFQNYNAGDVGPTGDFSSGLVGARTANPTSGMAMTGVGLSDPTYVYQLFSSDPTTIIIHSPQSLLGLNTNILAFADFYPVDTSNNPVGQWNAYAAFFHIGDPAHNVPPPTVDGKGYAFAFDDNGGYSSDISVALPGPNSASVAVFTQLSINLLPWETQTSYAVGAGAGGGPQVQVLNPDGSLVRSFFAFDPQFTGGVRVTSGDLNNDGYADTIVAAGPGGGPQVRAFDGRTGQVLFSFFAYDPAFAGGVYVGSGDVNGDGYDDIVTGAGAGGGPHVRVFSGKDGSVLRDFFAFDPGFSGGVTVAVGDVNGDGFGDIIAGAGPGGGPHVRVFDGHTGAVLQSFFAYAADYRGGVFVAVGNVRGGGRPAIITGAGAGLADGPDVRVFDATSAQLLASFTAGDAGGSGVRVGVFDVNGDGIAEILTGAGAGTGPRVKVYDGRSLAQLDNFFAFSALFAGGVYVADT